MSHRLGVLLNGQGKGIRLIVVSFEMARNLPLAGGQIMEKM